MSLETDFVALRTLHPIGATRILKDGLDRTVRVIGHRMALDCPSVQVRVLDTGSEIPAKAHCLRAARQAPAHEDVILGRDLKAPDKPALDAFYMMIQARYGRRAANAAIDAAENAITKVRSENRERGIDA